MAEIRRMIVETEADLRHARAVASPSGSPKRFIEFDAFAAHVRLRALNDALAAVIRERRG
jgi:hypothetical protein